MNDISSSVNMGIAVIVSTTLRKSLHEISLPSILNQSRVPDIVYIVADSNEDSVIDQVSKFNAANIQVKVLTNVREKNLSGAMNTVFSEMIADNVDPKRTFIAVLDDDDWWEQDYLDQCFKEALRSDSDWVVSGIIRHESCSDIGKPLTIPKVLTEKAFLVGNPHIQGSNLFVRFSKVLLAGGYDENLPSTTDRDLCLRLLALGDINITTLNRHMVHHLAYGEGRLSEKGSEKKCIGLKRFFYKYGAFMDEEDKNLFFTRAKEYFGCDLEIIPETKKVDEIPEVPKTAQHGYFNLVIGVIVSEKSCFGNIISDIIELNKKTESVSSIVVSDNTGQEINLPNESMSELSRAGIKLTIIESEEVEKLATEGKLGDYYTVRENRKGISFGRTVLHRFVYLESIKYTNPVAWIIDDDVSLRNIYWGTLDCKITEEELLWHIFRWKTNGISLVVGKVGGDPPVPVMSTARTQMLDLYYNFKELILNKHNINEHTKPNPDSDIIRRVPAYFYDFPETYFSHLETPVREYMQYSSLVQLSKNARMILRKAVTRKASYPTTEKAFGDRYYYADSEDFGPVRGGNTLILDIDCLRDFTNSSPKSGSISFRRGDTLWTVFNKRLGSRRPIKQNRTVISSPLMLIQDRRKEETNKEMQEKLISDTLGSAFVRSIDSILLEKSKNMNYRQDYYDLLDFKPSEMTNVINVMKREINRRALQIAMNGWRIRGLIQSIRSVIKEASSTRINASVEELDDIFKLCDRMGTLFSENNVGNIVENVRNFKIDDVVNFLQSIAKSCKKFGDSLPIFYPEDSIREVKSVIKETFASGELHNIGIGEEGIVFTDRINAYKYFHYGKYALKATALGFLKEKLLGKNYSGIANLRDVALIDGHLIIKEEYVVGEPYNGGMLKELINILRECKKNGMVIKNIAPKNLLSNGKCLKFIDLGRDFEVYTENGFLKMCMRTYLTLRWYFRPDLHQLLHRSNIECDLPELFGFKYFLDLLNEKYTGEISVPFVTSLFTDVRDKKILDFGCGKGQIADELAKNNYLTVYDKDMSPFFERHPTANMMNVLDKADLESDSDNQEKFDVVLLSLVLCTVSDSEAREILRQVRKLLNEGGEILIVICNPLNIHNIETGTHEKISTLGKYNDLFGFEKRMKISGNIRNEYHRPIDWYIREMRRTGFIEKEFSESEGSNLNFISPGSEFLMIKGKVMDNSVEPEVSLMIKASAMEWRTIEYQVKHIVSQLEGPEKFKEKFIITDRETKNFSRQYDDANLEAFEQRLQKLVNDGVIDKVIYASEGIAEKEILSELWFGLKCSESKSSNGQPVLTTLEGFDYASSRYILQIESDCIIYRDRREKSYLAEMIDVLSKNGGAITVSFPVYNNVKRPFTSGDGLKKWRTEVRNCLLNLNTLKKIRPLPNQLGVDGKLELPWHRSLDKKLSSGLWDSYRGSTGDAYFIHVPNHMKTDVNFWYNALKYHEDFPSKMGQLGKVDLQPNEIEEFLESRYEDMVVIVKGKDVPIPKIRRCFKSLLDQNLQKFSIIYVDAASDNGTDDYVHYIGKRLFSGRLTLFRNYVPLTSMENIFISVRKICKNPQSIIVLLDADDALIGNDTLSKVKSRYEEDVDLTVGTMIRTDKYKEYPVNFSDPRVNRGGNVWQHLRTFRKYLFDSISPEDLKINGQWISEADDWAYMIPMVEMADHPDVIRDIIYFYEPSPEKRERDIIRYEETIANIIAKASYKKVSNI